jgi:3-methyladenine DNA glycosylase AlkC
MKISVDRLNELNLGLVEAKNLMESLAIDFHILMPNVLPDFKIPDFPEKLGITKRMRLISVSLNEQYGFKIFQNLASHRSDTIRSLACVLLGMQDFAFAEKLALIKTLANDDNPGVREWAWMGLRDNLVVHLNEYLKLLKPFVLSDHERIRRFASEISRPRGVWCTHIKELRLQPWLAIELLEPLKSDKSNYVQLSVANWLNDASKDHPLWVTEICSNWLDQSDSLETKKICKRALRHNRKNCS